MIPKKIHYIWLGGKPLTRVGQKCLRSWQRLCPDYEIVRWDESNFDFAQNLYCREAYENKKYAFVSDYIRLSVLYNCGGIYLDTDVELLKPLDEFLSEGAFLGFENEKFIGTAVMGCESRHELFKKFLNSYENRAFVRVDGTYDETPNVRMVTDILLDCGLKQNGAWQQLKDITVFPSEYFCPKSYATRTLTLTENSAAIHHFDASWISREARLYLKYKDKFGKRRAKILFSLFHPILAFRLGRRKK